jgi:pilus assembly protein Flp/PilA
MSEMVRQPRLRPDALSALIADESGATAIEYGLVAALVSVFIMVAIGALGDTVVGIYDYVAGLMPT